MLVIGRSLNGRATEMTFNDNAAETKATRIKGAGIIMGTKETTGETDATKTGWITKEIRIIIGQKFMYLLYKRNFPSSPLLRN